MKDAAVRNQSMSLFLLLISKYNTLNLSVTFAFCVPIFYPLVYPVVLLSGHQL